MATYRARMIAESDGTWVAACVELPNTWSRGPTREAAVAKLRDEIRYRIELCPCSGVEDDYVQVEPLVMRGDDRRRHPSPLGNAVDPLPEPAPTRTRALRPAAIPTPVSTPAPTVRPTWAAARTVIAAPWRGTAGCPSWKLPRE